MIVNLLKSPFFRMGMTVPTAPRMEPVYRSLGISFGSINVKTTQTKATTAGAQKVDCQSKVQMSVCPKTGAITGPRTPITATTIRTLALFSPSKQSLIRATAVAIAPPAPIDCNILKMIMTQMCVERLHATLAMM